MLLNNARICLNMSEIEPPVTLRALIDTWAYLESWNWNYTWNYIQKIYNMLDRDVNTVELLNISGF